jgi:DNA/RNA-binding domain of Phe-tRNA-synthetase-like protein
MSLQSGKVILSTEIRLRHPGYGAGMLVASGIDQSTAAEAAIDRLKEEALQQLRSKEHRALAAQECDRWRAIYRIMGLKASSTLCSFESLYKRAIKGTIPRINAVVDLYNICSLKHALCFGAYDAQTVRGGIEIRHGREERMQAIGGDLLDLGSQHVVYADDQGPMCAYWNHRDSDRTKIGIDTTHVVFFADELDIAQGRAHRAMKDLAFLLRQAFGAGIRIEQ